MSALDSMETSGKWVSVSLLVAAQVAALSLWFSTAAILSDLYASGILLRGEGALLSSAVQAGFVVGALLVALTGTADRLDPRALFAVSTVLAALANMLLLVVDLSGPMAVLLRGVTGAALAGVYPIGMKMAAAWGVRDRGLLVGLLVGALVLGSASPYFIAYQGGVDWRMVVYATSAGGGLAGLLILFTRLGPFGARASGFSFKGLKTAWTNKPVRYAYIGYFGHMIELYAMWAWLATALTLGFSKSLDGEMAASTAKLVTFIAIGSGALACALGGWLADRFGKAQLTIGAMALSGLSALAFGIALQLGLTPIVLIAIALIWGLSISPDSPQFSALVADHAANEHTGSLLTLQTALGFALTILTVQALPLLASAIGWPAAMASLSVGPLLGVWAMLRFRKIVQSV